MFRDLIDFGVSSPYQVGEFFQAFLMFFEYQTNIYMLIATYMTMELYNIFMAKISGSGVEYTPAADSPFFRDPGEIMLDGRLDIGDYRD